GGWTESGEEGEWAACSLGDALRAMDRFHQIPDAPPRASSWAEWLYFRGQTGVRSAGMLPLVGGSTGDSAQFYLTFLVGAMDGSGRSPAGVRLQLDRGGRVGNYGDRELVDHGAVIRSAPDLTIGRSRVWLEGLRYHVTLDLPVEEPLGVDSSSGSRSRLTGEIVIDAFAGRSLPPVVIRGAAGWLSGYTVPVMSGRLSGSLVFDGARVALDGTAYHDHNW